MSYEDKELDLLLEGMFGNSEVEPMIQEIVDTITSELGKVLQGDKKAITVKGNTIYIKGTTLLNRMSSVKMNDNVEGIVLRKYGVSKPKVKVSISYFKVGGKASAYLYGHGNSGGVKAKYGVGAGLIFTTSIKIKIEKASAFKVTKIEKLINNRDSSVNYEKLSEENVTDIDPIDYIEEGVMSEIWSAGKVKSKCEKIGRYIASYKNTKDHTSGNIKNVIKQNNLVLAMNMFKRVLKTNIKAQVAMEAFNECMSDPKFKERYDNLETITVTQKLETNGFAVGRSIGVVHKALKLDIKSDSFRNDYTPSKLTAERNSLSKDIITLIDKMLKDGKLPKEKHDIIMGELKELSNIKRNTIYVKTQAKFRKLINK